MEVVVRVSALPMSSRPYALLPVMRCRLPFFLFVLVLSVSASHPSLAQSTDADPWAGVEEMVVSGSGGVAMLTQAPTSVTAFDSDELSALGAVNISDLAEHTPNLEINSPFAASNPQIFIRGVGLQDSNSNASASVAVMLDDVYINSPAGQLSSLFDIETVEVLRGPQGAQYGRNASAGVVRIVTNRPVHEVKGGGTLNYGRFNQLEAEGFLNVPIVPDILATRFAFKYVSRDPLGTNRCAADRDNNPRLNNIFLTGTKCYAGMVQDPARRRNGPVGLPPEDTNDRKNWFARLSFLLEPTEDMSFVLKFRGGQNLSLAPQFQNRGTSPITQPGGGTRPNLRATGRRYLDFDTCTAVDSRGYCIANDRKPGAGDPFDGDYGRGGDERLTLGAITLNSDWTNGRWSASSVTSFDWVDREVVIDFDATPFVQADAFVTDESWQIFEDAKISWDGDYGIVLTAGVQYFQDRLKADNSFWNTPSSNLQQQIVQRTIAAAGFGYVEWELTENLILEGGARVNYERKNFTISSFYNPFNNDTFGDPLTGYNNRRELAEQVRPSGEIIFRYEPTTDIKLYGRFSRGYKGQHFNGNALSPAQEIEPVSAEFVNSFELGWSATALDGIVNWNGAAFYYDYENQQVYQLQNAEGVSIPVAVLANAEDSRLIGMESDLTIAWEGLRWFNSIGVLYSEYSNFTRTIEEVSVSQTGDVSISFEVENYSGNALVNAPEFNLIGSLSYEWELPDTIGGSLTPRFDYRYKAQVFYTPENDSRIGADPRWIFDVRMDYTTLDGNISIGGWVRNLTDQYFPITAYDRKKGTGAIVYVVSDPRTYGMTVSYRF